MYSPHAWYAQSKLVAEHRRSGRAAFLHLGLIPESVGNSIWNVQCEKLGKCDEGTGCGATASGLLPGWEDFRGTMSSTRRTNCKMMMWRRSAAVGLLAIIAATATEERGEMGLWRAMRSERRI